MFRPIACHAIPVGSGVFTRVHEVPICKAFSSCAFTADHNSSKYLLTETLTFCLGQLIASTVDSHSDTAIILPRWRGGRLRTKSSLLIALRLPDQMAEADRDVRLTY
jgi:hypothetical protein